MKRAKYRNINVTFAIFDIKKPDTKYQTIITYCVELPILIQFAYTLKKCVQFVQNAYS